MSEQTGTRSRLVAWFWRLLIGLIVVAVLSIISSTVWHEQIRSFSETWGNFASVLGLWFGLIAFLLTILTLLLTAQAEKDAVRKANLAAEKSEQAVQQANTRTAFAVERLGMMVLENGCVTLARSVKSIEALAAQAMSSTTESEWKRLWKDSAEKCREVAESTADLLDNALLTESEEQNLKAAKSRLHELALFIERTRLPSDKNGKLPTDQRADALVQLQTVLSDIRHRVRRRVYEVSNEVP